MMFVIVAFVGLLQFPPKRFVFCAMTSLNESNISKLNKQHVSVAVFVMIILRVCERFYVTRLDVRQNVGMFAASMMQRRVEASSRSYRLQRGFQLFENEIRL